MTPQSRSDERRRFPRSRRGFTAIEDRGEAATLNHVDNISANGVLCHTSEPIPLMTKMRMALDLPHPVSKRVECEGIVVRCDPHEQGENHYKVAILYTKVNEEDRRAIATFVEHDLAHAHAAE
ncbi:MAG: PilZ domain-containing protein [Candidatus Hydrogenedentota bacterium]